MIAIEINLVKDLTKNLEKRLTALAGNEVTIGMFNEQGEHYSGFSYVGLFKYLSTGDPERNLPARNTLYVAKALHPLSKSPLKDDLREFLSNLDSRSKSAKNVLKGTGEFYRDKVKGVFGNDTLLDPKAASTQEGSISPSTPLVETGSLVKKVAYRLDQGTINE